MPRIPITDVSAGDRRAERRLLGIEHLVLALVLLALYAVAMFVALDPGALRACSGPDAGSSGSSCAGHSRS